ncbi:alpha/beta hydrolase fold domain-containing protein [Amycolatopsis sp. FDAARGOS 1241]|uniref:alpha/beta hydrolase fold domain-containing protein n=1 Tax=Amycolatopsis sp. FDAARGOS 1241 TaxID=2778070 RepID=UPI001950040C|nr:alpha/beta hydrolase [Amycolatopsis sp. FDAARGOS 1241]QRP49691.1 alpha/beta hydrolase fold domain-containing protein [Amycolatopsis sp. FDAARGOS 1241]
MVSTKAKLYMAYQRASGHKRFYDDARTLHRTLRSHQRPSMARPPHRIRRQCTVDRHEVRGFACWTLRPRRGTAGLHVLHLHGGGYVEEIQQHHWRFAAELVARLGCAVTLPIYPLVPRHDHTETLPMVHAAYEQLAAGADHRVVSGDSAGGALALAIAQRLRDEGRPQPDGLVLISPWLDVTLEDPISVVLDEHDPILGITGLREAGRIYSEGTDPHDPRISPLHADLTGLGPVSLFIGTRDLLLPDARRFRDRAHDAGVALDYREYPGMFHNWVMQNLPEGREALNHVERFLRRVHQRGNG